MSKIRYRPRLLGVVWVAWDALTDSALGRFPSREQAVSYIRDVLERPLIDRAEVADR